MRPRSRAMVVFERLCRMCREIDETSLGGHEITSRELVVLDAIAEGACAVPSIAARLGVSSTSAATILGRLEHRKLVARTRSRGRQVFQIEITAAGRDMRDKYRDLDALVERELEKRLGLGVADTITALEKLLAKERPKDVEIVP